MKTYGEVDVQIHVFLTSTVVGRELSASRPGPFTTGKDRRYLLDRSLGGPQSQCGLLGEDNQSLYRLNYPGSNNNNNEQ
jgi:hypothetical protein